MANELYDRQTIAFYDREAAAYAASGRRSRRLDGFISRVGAGANVLELGCGGGHDAEAMLAAGIKLTPTDASSELARIASQRLGIPVRVMRFDELDEVNVYAGVWANACLLHVPYEALASVLERIFRSLRNGGLLFASFKGGDIPDRDQLGRYYNFPSKADLEHCYATSAPWAVVKIEQGAGGGYDGVARTWLHCTAIK